MAKENVGKFYEELLSSDELQVKLQKAEEKFDGDTNDRTAVAEMVIIPIAKEAGFDITVEDIRYFERKKIADSGISEEELENVSGGSGMCEVVGGGSGGGLCVAIGFNGDSETGFELGAGIYLCVFLGIGGGGWF